MRIIIKSGRGRPQWALLAPSSLLTSALARRIIIRLCDKNNIELDAQEIKALQKALKESRRQLKKQPLIEVESSTGERVKIIL